MALIPVSRAADQIPNFNTNDNDILQDIVNSCSAVIERWCNRTFAVTSYDELYDGSGYSNLLLNNYPLVSVDRVMFNPVSVLNITNLGSGVSRASFRLSSSSLILTSAASGTTTTRTISRSSCATLGDLATAINTYSADGWNAAALGIYTTWSTSDLWAPQGGDEVRWAGYGYLWHHVTGVPLLMQNPAIGEIESAWQFMRGYQRYRVIYSAGCNPIPPAIQQACAELSAAVYVNRGNNPNFQSENLGQYSYTNLADHSFNNLSIASRYSLNLYKNHRIVRFKV